MGFEKIMEENKIKDLINLLYQKDNFLLVTHKNYDEDAISSLLSLSLILDFLGKNNFIFLDEKIKEEYLNFPKVNEIRNEIKAKIENIIFLDCDRILRVSEDIIPFMEGKTKIFLDHHSSNLFEGEFNFVFPEAIATSEIIFYLAKKLNALNENLAELILLGILGDTNFLRNEYSKETYLRIFRIITELLFYGADYYKLLFNFHFKNWDDLEKETQILRKINKDDGLVWFVLNNEEIEKSSKILTILNEIKNIKVIIVFKEKEKEIQISFRSKGNLDVAKLAKEYFNGGGHKNASGGYLKMNLEEAINYTLEVIKKYLKENAL